jgi:Pregnancy-associated plasma protein-A
MKKILSLLSISIVLLAVSSCADIANKTKEPVLNTLNRGARADAENGRNCAANDVLEENMREDPSLRGRMEEIEAHTQRYIKSQKNGRVGATGTLIIPIVVNVIYNTAQQNISDDQILSQIRVLNKDFSAANADLSQLPNVFSGLVSNYEIQFTLDHTVRKSSTKTSWGTRDAMKSAKKGGIDADSPATKLNIWVCNIGGGILGYAQFPGGNSSTDGVVIGPQYFGDTGYLAPPYHKGRTATHEIGHWQNLRHIWGDANCGNDQVTDTPTQQTSNFGCPTFPHLTCSNGPNGDLFMNYMDYTDDACMYMFTAGQKVRSRAIFALGGSRATFNP